MLLGVGAGLSVRQRRPDISACLGGICEGRVVCARSAGKRRSASADHPGPLGERASSSTALSLSGLAAALWRTHSLWRRSLEERGESRVGHRPQPRVDGVVVSSAVRWLAETRSYSRLRCSIRHRALGAISRSLRRLVLAHTRHRAPLASESPCTAAIAPRTTSNLLRCFLNARSASLRTPSRRQSRSEHHLLPRIALRASQPRHCSHSRPRSGSSCPIRSRMVRNLPGRTSDS